jgi:hypothetical protein
LRGAGRLLRRWRHLDRSRAGRAERGRDVLTASACGFDCL